jgi:hypothetical protein
MKPVVTRMMVSIALLLCISGCLFCHSGCTSARKVGQGRILLHECRPVDESAAIDQIGEQLLYGTHDAWAERICIASHKASNCLAVTVLAYDGTVILPPYTIADHAIIEYVGDPWYGDLNADGKVDFFFPVSMGGCGSAVGFEDAVLVLSLPEGGYNVRIIPTYQAEPDDFIDTDGDGDAEMVQRTGTWNEQKGELILTSKVIHISK